MRSSFKFLTHIHKTGVLYCTLLRANTGIFAIDVGAYLSEAAFSCFPSALSASIRLGIKFCQGRTLLAIAEVTKKNVFIASVT